MPETQDILFDITPEIRNMQNCAIRAMQLNGSFTQSTTSSEDCVTLNGKGVLARTYECIRCSGKEDCGWRRSSV